MHTLIDKETDFEKLVDPKNISIASGSISLLEVIEKNITLNIPIYQRLYVWKQPQIVTLLEDLKNAFEKENERYFLGGVMLSANKEGNIDLIDGQQRFTTLWLLCDCLVSFNPSLKDFTHKDERPRIYFSIREKAQEYLQDIDSFSEYLNHRGEVLKGAATEINEIIPLAKARILIKQQLKSFRKDGNFDPIGFSDFILKKIVLTTTFMPAESDMNRVFEAMNNRGKQLLHHELLKSKLLKSLTNKSEKTIYSTIWDACSQMDSYIEKNIKEVAGLTWKKIFLQFDDSNNFSSGTYDLSTIDIFELLNDALSTENLTKKSLIRLLEEDDDVEINDDNKDIVEENDYSSKSVRSIISFPSFLLHTLRVYQAQNFSDIDTIIEVNDKRLLQQFDFIEDNHFDDGANVKAFIELLWNLRVRFDRNVIKWISESGSKDEYHSIEYLQVSKSTVKNKNGTINENISAQRAKDNNETVADLMTLQGMLYHSQELTTQYWLTPFLLYLLGENLPETLLLKLEKLDNHLFFKEKHSEEDKLLKDRTFNAIFKENEFDNHLKNAEEYFNKGWGVDYPNYIFYKLEYILWKNRNNLIRDFKLDQEKWDNYRLTAKSSVEHIFPRNTKEENLHILYMSEEEKENFDKEYNPLDDFGNLVLLSPGMNSEYSNKPYKEKKGQFDSKSHIDSLKSSVIFSHSDWNWQLVNEHKERMIEEVKNYLIQITSV
ncbi:DUF262 domain-containing protein [Christiangramia forsetii]|uniref:Protein containing DUF262 and DUF1524 n=2 Tax=Christiangramia forsetii TaxID=411153 RepID=A0M4J9_CHRFK|nr:DUF262 domain-containing protein [Christiangramia forsetii]GGG23269.1 hypothetical protein GCM10011532_02990 [Christiangramia forsetii]CAL67544.1 protein containing DUF262 and DUF1524 [Christiangramia forsetii KT0803]